MSYTRKMRDAASYRERLDRFLTDACLLFNPYTVSDRRLWEGLMKMRWRGEFSLTQMVILHFIELQTEGKGPTAVERLICRIGDSPDVFIKNMKAFTERRTAADTLQPIRSTIDGKPVRSADRMRPLVGKSVFVSRIVNTVTPRGSFTTAMAMHRLKGDLATDAPAIRQAIVASKLEMLDRFLKNPECNFYLDGEPQPPVDIAAPINRLKTIIAAYPSVTPPAD